MSFVVICGSLRADSINMSLSQKIVYLGKTHNKDVLLLDIINFPMYNQDLETKNGTFPLEVEKARNIVASKDNIIFVTPEHNSMPSSALKNVYDWLSRKGHDKSPLSNKNIYVLSAAGYGYGIGARTSMWTSLSNLNKYMNMDCTLKTEYSFGINIFNGQEYCRDGIFVHEETISKIKLILNIE